MAKTTKRPRGRPKLDKPLGSQLNVRVDGPMREAIDAYRDRHGAEYNLREVSDVVRHILGRALRQEGLLSAAESFVGAERGKSTATAKSAK